MPKRGMVIREIVSHPFCVHPSFYSALKHYGPEDHLDTLMFEPCSTVSVEPILKRVHGYYRPWPLDEVRLSNRAGWWDCFTTAACERESTYPFELARQEDDEWRAGRSRAVAAGGFYRSQIVASGKVYQLFVALRTHGYFRAANILAAAVYAGRLRRRIGARRRAVILVPTDEALSGADGDKVRALLQPAAALEALERALAEPKKLRCAFFSAVRRARLLYLPTAANVRRGVTQRCRTREYRRKPLRKQTAE